MDDWKIKRRSEAGMNADSVITLGKASIWRTVRIEVFRALRLL